MSNATTMPTPTPDQILRAAQSDAPVSAAQIHREAASRFLGERAPLDIIDAKARCYGWRPFAAHTVEEKAAHMADVAAVDAYMAKRTRYDIASAVGDES